MAGREVDVIDALRKISSPSLANAIETAVDEFAGDRPRGDDQTLLLLRRTGD